MFRKKTPPGSTVQQSTDGDAIRETIEGDVVSRTKKVIEETQESPSVTNPKIARSHRSKNEGKNDADKTEIRLDDDFVEDRTTKEEADADLKEKPAKAKKQFVVDEPSEPTGQSGYRAIRTRRPSGMDTSRTECQLESVIDNDDATPNVFQIIVDEFSSLPVLKDMYEFVWRRSNNFVKALIVGWLIISTFHVLKIIVTVINVYTSLEVDDCYTASFICRRFGFACFTQCGVSRWSIFMSKIFGE